MTDLGVLEGLTKHVKKAATFVAYQWPGVIEADDAEQDIYVRLLESPGTVQKIKDMESEADRYRAIVGMANQIASKERSDYAHYKGNYRYSVGEVKALLEAGALDKSEIYADVATYDSTGGKSHPGPSAPINDAVLDLRQGMKLLAKRNKSYAEALVRRYLFGEYAETQIQKNNLNRGLEALTNEMNRVQRTAHVTRDDGLGTRKAISNAKAQTITNDQWDGNYVPSPWFGRDGHVEKEVWE